MEKIPALATLFIASALAGSVQAKGTKIDAVMVSAQLNGDCLAWAFNGDKWLSIHEELDQKETLISALNSYYIAGRLGHVESQDFYLSNVTSLTKAERNELEELANRDLRSIKRLIPCNNAF